MKHKTRKLFSIFLALVMVLGLAPAMSVTAAAAENTDGKAIVLGTGGIKQYDTVYMGTYKADDETIIPVPWFALNTDGFMLSKYTIGTSNFCVASYMTFYPDSVLKDKMDELYSGQEKTLFQSLEQGAIKETTLSGKSMYSSSSKPIQDVSARLFPLSLDEAGTIGLESDYLLKAWSINDPEGSTGEWWLRSSYSIVYAYFVSVNGDYGNDNDNRTEVLDDLGVRPAFHLDPDSVLFTSAAVGGKAGATGELSEITEHTGSEWKLTLKDESRKFAVTEASGTAAPGGTVKLNYTGATVKTYEAPNEWISAIIADEDGNALYYGRLTQPEEAEGDVEVKIPSELKDGKYILKLFSEQYNGDYKTDYASDFTDVTLTVANTRSVTVTPGANMTKTATSGAETQTVQSGNEMTAVVYEADEDYYFPEDYSVATVNGVSVTRDGWTKIIVSGKPTADVAITLTAPTEKTKEPTPNATFTATGYDTGTLSNMAANMQYSLDGGINWTSTATSFETGASVDLTGVSPGKILVVKLGNGTTTINSDAQEITVTRAETPALTVTQPTAIGGTGSIPTTAAHEYRKDGSTEWQDCGDPLTELAPGTYDVRVKASGTVLASEAQSIKITAATVTVTFDPNGGTVNGLDTDTATTDTNGKLASLPTPTHSGSYRFDGWYTEKTGGTKVDTNTVFTANDTIYAHWTYNGGGSGGGSATTKYTLTYNTNGGNTITATRHDKNATVNLAATPTREGYDFTGWFAEADLTNKITSIKMDSDKTVYAGWKEKGETPEEPEKPENPGIVTPDALDGDNHIAYVAGYPDGAFRPDRPVTRAETASMIYRLLKAERRAQIYTTTNHFSDVKSTLWYNEAVSSMANGGYVAGYPDGTFGGTKNITRAEFVTMLVNFMGISEGTAAFSDVKESHWAYKQIATASKGLVAGYPDGTFRPDQPITRAEAVSILNRILNRGVNETSRLGDFKNFMDNANPSAWYYFEIIEAANSHEYEGKRPNENWLSIITN